MFLLFDPGIEKNVSLVVVTVDGGNILPKKTKTNHKKKSYLTDEHTKIHRKDGPKRFNEHFAICVFFVSFQHRICFSDARHARVWRRTWDFSEVSSILFNETLEMK